MTIEPTVPGQPKRKDWHRYTADEVLAELDTAATGLSATQAAKRLAAMLAAIYCLYLLERPSWNT